MVYAAKNLQRDNLWELPGGFVVRTQRFHYHGLGSIPDGGRFNISWSNQACAPQLLSLCSAAWESQLLSPSATTAEACMSRACALQQKKSPQWEAHLPQRWVAPACHNQRKVHTATKTLHTQINKYFLKKEKTPRNKYMQNKNEYDISLMAKTSKC